jgi:hypothetical protein
LGWALGAGCYDSGTPSKVSAIQFQDVTQSSGIRFVHHTGDYGAKLMPETVGSGVAFLDYDNDGFQDLLYIDSAPWPKKRTAANRTRPGLYHNNGNGTFTDDTHKAGLDFMQYGMGVAAGDYDNDGWTDLFLTAIGPNHLFHNRRNGTFEDVTSPAGVRGVDVQPGGIDWKWSSSASWLDYDRDGLLDLLVLQYVKWTIESDVFCGVADQKAYCPPTAYEGVPATLYHNLGAGKFKDVSAETGLVKASGKGFGVAVADYNGDGWPDIAIANDLEPNLLFLNKAGKRFEESGYAAGIAVNDSGTARAGMGLDCADWTNEGRFGLLVANFSRESLSLFRNEGERFTNDAYSAGLGASSQLFLTFGVFFFDFDNDGRQDVFAANGHIDDLINAKDAAITYEERPLVYRNLGERKLEEVGEKLGPATLQKIVARGAVPGDFDNDGDEDIALVWNKKRGLLWRNDGGNANHWLGLVLHGTKSNRDGIGAIVRVKAGGLVQTLLRKSGGSFLSERDPRLLAGLGSARDADLEITWPSGEITHLSHVQSGSYYEVTEGQTNAVPLPAAKARK